MTDDLSGVSLDDSSVDLYSPSTNQWTYGFLDIMSGDSYTATLTIPMFAEAGIWRDWEVYLYDAVGNGVVYYEDDLIAGGVNIAVGVGVFSPTYVRTISLNLSRTRASGSLDSAQASTCDWFVPVLLQAKTRSGWRMVGQALATYQGKYSIPIHRKGKYRVTATAYGLGTPILTTCSKASTVRSSK